MTVTDPTPDASTKMQQKCTKEARAPTSQHILRTALPRTTQNMGKSAKFTRRPGVKLQKQAMGKDRVHKPTSTPTAKKRKQAPLLAEKPVIDVPQQMDVDNPDVEISLGPPPPKSIIAHKQPNYIPSSGKEVDYVKILDAGRKKKMSSRQMIKKKVVFNKMALLSK
ncbi:hypothetical protein SeLEV6574_g04605 [Synchytrium endobioticum]|nr:hypothetical protein SeLEV6574_g04605 [Synchytrium endobioticum]